jgi:hypothetical protein
VEYQEGYTHCTDCNTPLVESLAEAEVVENYEPFFQAEDKKVAEKLVSFFEYSDLKSKLQYDDENEVYVVTILSGEEKKARKLYEAFYFVEYDRMKQKASANNATREQVKERTGDIVSEEAEEDADSSSEKMKENIDEASEDTEDLYENINLETDVTTDEEEYSEETPVDDISGYERNNENVYVMKADQYKDLSGSVWIFLLFGIAGLIFVVLNIAGVISIFNGWIPNIVMGALFLFFLYIAISTNQKAKKVQLEIEAENKMTKEINEWLNNTVTESFLSSLHNNEISDELNFIKMTDTVKEMLIKEFGPQNLAYLDRLIDEFYSQHYDNQDEI